MPSDCCSTVFFPVLLGGYWCLAFALTRDFLAASVAAFVAFFNSTVLLPAFGGHTNATNAIAFVPWMFLGAYQGVRKRSPAWFLLLFCASFLVSAYDVRWIPPAFVAVLAFAWLPYLQGRPAPRRLFALSGLCAVGGVVAENFYWMLPSVLGYRVAPAPPVINLDSTWALISSVMNMPDALAAWDPHFASDLQHAPMIVQHIGPFGLLWPLAVVTLGIIGMRKHKAAPGVALAIYLVGAFLVKGENPPLGGVYTWSFSHLPIFDAYRDPSKFTFLVIAGMSLCVALGVAGLRDVSRKWLRGVAVAFVIGFLLVENAHAFALIGTGVTAERAIPARYVALNRRLQGDRVFGRVLALYTDSRWLEQTPLHPVVSGTDIASAEFAPWLNPSISFSSVPFVYSLAFRQLLRWAAVRYVLIDNSVYDDASIGGLGESTVQLNDALLQMPFLKRVASFSGVTLYLVEGSSPHAWTSSAATFALGSDADMNALAFIPRLAPREPVVFDDGKDARNIFRREIAFKEPSRSDLRAVSEVDLVAPADSVLVGPMFGATVVRRREFRGPRNASVWKVEARSSIPLSDRSQTYDSWRADFPGGEVLENVIPSSLEFRDANGSTWNFRAMRIVHSAQRISIENPMPSRVRASLYLNVLFGEVAATLNGKPDSVISRGQTVVHFDLPPGHATLELRPLTGYPIVTSASLQATVDAALGRAPWYTERLDPVPLYDGPIVDLGLPHAKGEHFLVVLHLRDRRNGNALAVVIPRAEFVSPIDVRPVLWFSVLSQHRDATYNIAIDDEYDYLDLVAVSLRIPRRIKRADPRAWPITLDIGAPYAQPIDSGDRVPTRTSSPLQFPSVWSQRGWVGRVCTVTTAFGNSLVYVTHADPIRIAGIDLDGSAFAQRWDRVRAIASMSSVAALELPLPARRAKYIIPEVAAPRDLSFAAIAEYGSWPDDRWTYTGFKQGSVIDLAALRRPMPWQMTHLVLVASSPTGAAVGKITVGPVVESPGKGQVLAQTRIAWRGPKLVMSSSFGTGDVPILIGAQSGVAPPVTTHNVDLGATQTSMELTMTSGDHWLVFSEGFDPGWRLYDDRGRTVGLHQRVYGAFNAWYQKAGFHGRYRLVYRPDIIAPIGFLVGLALLGLSFALMIAAMARGRLSF